MKSSARFTLLTVLCLSSWLSSCKQSGNDPATSGAPRIQPGSCNIGKWNSAFLPLNLKISSDFSGDFNNADQVSGLNLIEQMAKNWNDSVPGTALFQVPFSSTSSTGNTALTNFRDSEIGIYKSFNWFSNVSPNALAITQFYGVVRSDGRLGTYIDLTHADIIMNYRDFGTSFSMNGNSFLDYDVPTIILHEMGHLLGLCHESYATSIMAPYYINTQRSLKSFDSSKISALYLNNQNYSPFTAKTATSKTNISSPIGSEVSGIIELNANGHCRHFVDGKLVHEHN